MEKIERWLKKFYLWGFIGLILVSPFEKLAVKAFFWGLVLIYLILGLIKYRADFLRKMFPETRLNLVFTFFIIISCISTIFGIDPIYSQRIVFGRYLLFIAVFWMSYQLLRDSTKNLYPLTVSLLALGLFIGLGGMRDFLCFHNIADSPYRLFSVFGKGIFMSAFLPFFFPLCFAVFSLSKDRILRYLSFSGLLFLLPVLVFHGSRLVWVSVFVSLIFTICLRFRAKMVFLLGFILLVSLIIAPSLAKARAKTLLNPLSRATLDDRIDLNKRAFNIFKNCFLIGSGPGAFKELYSPPPGFEHISTYIHSHAHNTYLEVAAEMGVLGLLAFLAIFFIFFQRVFTVLKGISAELEPFYIGMVGSVFALLITALGGSLILVGFQDSVLFWLFLGALFAIK